MIKNYFPLIQNGSTLKVANIWIGDVIWLSELIILFLDHELKEDVTETFVEITREEVRDAYIEATSQEATSSAIEQAVDVSLSLIYRPFDRI